VCSANDYFEQSQVGNLIVILCSNGEKMGILRLAGTHTSLYLRQNYMKMLLRSHH
jgi:hypothetical protein